jgi:hypothetical protein
LTCLDGQVSPQVKKTSNHEKIAKGYRDVNISTYLKDYWQGLEGVVKKIWN